MSQRGITSLELPPVEWVAYSREDSHAIRLMNYMGNGSITKIVCIYLVCVSPCVLQNTAALPTKLRAKRASLK